MLQTILRFPDVKARIGLGRSAIYARMDPRSKRYDPTFPRPISLGEKSIGWVESELNEWIELRIAARRMPRTINQEVRAT